MIKVSLMLFKALFTLCLHFENSRQEIFTSERLKAIKKGCQSIGKYSEFYWQFFYVNNLLADFDVCI